MLPNEIYVIASILAVIYSLYMYRKMLDGEGAVQDRQAEKTRLEASLAKMRTRREDLEKLGARNLLMELETVNKDIKAITEGYAVMMWYRSQPPPYNFTILSQNNFKGRRLKIRDGVKYQIHILDCSKASKGAYMQLQTADPSILHLVCILDAVRMSDRSLHYLDEYSEKLAVKVAALGIKLGTLPLPHSTVVLPEESGQ